MAKNSECVNETATRIRATRVDAEDLIDRMLQETGISDNGFEDQSTDRGNLVPEADALCCHNVHIY